MKNQPLIIIAGPTAVGKTKLSIELAKKINGAIISADSMQIYKYMDIGSAKVSKKEMQGIKHYLIDELMPDTEFNIVKFQEMAKKALEEIYAQNKVPIVAGGTGFYIQALLYDVEFANQECDDVFRKKMDEYANLYGNHMLHEKLKDIDLISYNTIHENNRKRVIRALEYYHLSGKPISEHNLKEQQKKSNYNFAYFVLTDERSNLYARINERVEIMLENGLLEEVKRLKEMGFHANMVSMQGLGYKEILRYLDGQYNLDMAIDCIKKETRHFAKRQLTWFKREKDVIWYNKKDYMYNEDAILDNMLQVLSKKGIIQ